MALIFKEGTSTVEGTDQAIIDSVKAHLQNSGLIIRTADQDRTLQQKAIDDAFATRNNQFDQTIKEATGIDREANEKTYDYLKRASGELKKVIEGKEAKIIELQKSGGVDETVRVKELKEQIAALQGNYDKLKKESTEQVENLKKETFNVKIQNEIKAIEAKIRPLMVKMDPEGSTDISDAVVKAKVEKFLSEHTATEVEGVIVWKDKSGQVKRDENAQAAPTEKLLMPYFEPVIDKSRRQGGTGSGQGGNGSGGAGSGGNGGAAGGKIDWSKETFPEIKNRVALTEFLIKEKKINLDTKEGAEEFQAAQKAIETATGKPLPLKG